MKLKLTRPIVFFDLETTGTNINTDRIVEISVVKLMPDGSVTSKTRRLNPEMPIPAEATAVHHITDADVADEPTFRQVANSLSQFFTGCDIAGFNSNRFDIPLLDQEFERAGIDFDFSRARFIDVQTIFHKKEPRTLVAAYRYYCGKELEGAHGALADTTATMEVLLAQLERYEDLPTDVAALSEFATNSRNVDLMGRLVYDDQGREVINFGKYKGRLADEVLAHEPGYYSWKMGGEFANNTKKAFTRVK
ncbi:MAG: 3'-5' exonuclease, partial [Muribaculaceae bacterium]|nr:3'-5' exonuclease [Muribaculaceae bacterium]